MTSKNYKNTKIYKIWSLLGDDIYIGSTTKDYLSQRMTTHRYNYNKYKKTNLKYITSFILFDKYGIENCSIELLEAKECYCLDEVKQLEGSYIRKLECVNKNIAGRTNKEYHQDNKEVINIRHKIYYKENKEHISIQQNEYRNDNKEKIKKYYENNKEENNNRAKQYYKDNKEQVKKYRDENKEKIKLYYEANKKKINEQNRINRQLKKEQKMTSLE